MIENLVKIDEQVKKMSDTKAVVESLKQKKKLGHEETYRSLLLSTKTQKTNDLVNWKTEYEYNGLKLKITMKIDLNSSRKRTIETKKMSC